MKILNKLTLKNLRMNKSRTIVTIIGIILSAALITTVSGMALTAQQTMLDAEIKSTGDYEISYSIGTNTDKIKDIESNRNVANVYIEDYIGVAYLNNPKFKNRPYVAVKAFNENALQDCFKTKLAEGRYPKADNELLLSQEFIKSNGRKYSVGDTISLALGERYSEKYNLKISPEQTYGEAYDENSCTVENVEESLINKQTKAYKIVGVIEEARSGVIYDANSACCYVFTHTDGKTLGNHSTVYVDIKPEYEKDYAKVASQITGVKEDLFKVYQSGDYSDEEFDEYHKELSKIKINFTQLTYKGCYEISDQTMSMLSWLAGIIIAIVILASVFVIRNSFAISITEKTKLYGMMASVGATRRQIRRNVLFEGFCLGLIGIPLGLLLGVGVIAALTTILNILLAESLNGISFVYIIPVVPMIFAVVLSAVVIFLSSITSAVRASRIAPVDAIRGNKDIKLTKKQKKYKSPKFIKKLFGTGGDIAYKNLKRSKKKYRTTVISIVVSVALFVSISAFVDYGIKYTDDFYTTTDYNIVVSCNNEFKNEDFEKISNLEGVSNCYYSICGYSGYLNMNKKSILNSESLIDVESIDKDTCQVDIDIVAINDNVFKNTLSELGLSSDNYKNKALINNQCKYKDKSGITHIDKIFDLKDNSKLTIGIPEVDENGEGNYKISTIEVSKAFYDMPKSLENYSGINSGNIIVSASWLKAHTTNSYISNVFVYADDDEEVEQKIYDLNIENASVYNIAKSARQYNSIVLVFEIFIYGFIIVISLIGVTNIFNTITTNMRLRSKEFAMLKSVGMTKKEFNRMIRLESLFYGTKSLIIGIPLGILGAFGICYGFSQKIVYDFVIPWKAILISILFVFAIVWLIMNFSISKVSKQNIIETIRNDNI